MVSLLLLLVMTMIGVTAVQVTSLEEKMAGNTRDRNLAFQAAEAALRVGENAIAAAVAVDANGQLTGMGIATFEALFNGATTGYYAAGTVPGDLLTGDTQSWGGDNVVSANVDLASVAAPPKYVIEKLNSADAKQHPFRITSYATGGTDSAVVVLQSTYRIDEP